MAAVPVYCTQGQSIHRISVQSLNKSIRIQGIESFGGLGPNPRTEYQQEMTPPGGPAYERAVVEDLNMVPRPMSIERIAGGPSSCRPRTRSSRDITGSQAARVSGRRPVPRRDAASGRHECGHCDWGPVEGRATNLKGFGSKLGPRRAWLPKRSPRMCT